MDCSSTSNISLIDLSAQFPFQIDDEIKKEICFGETLIISCGHFDGHIESESSDSEFDDSTVTSAFSNVVVERPPVEIKDFVEETPTPVDEEDNDFHFFFFPDCKKPLPPQNSETSLLIVDGLPKVNPAILEKKYCKCDVNQGGKCICFENLPCSCGAKTKLECTCPKQEAICICHDGEPMPVCLCKGSDVCLCHPDGKPRPVCTCDQVDKPCICHPGKYPSPVCTCKHKPCLCHPGKYPSPICTCNREHKQKFHFDELKSIGELPGEESEEEIRVEDTKEATGETPCDCQKPDTPPGCFCIEGKESVKCTCGIQNPCVCERIYSRSDISCKTGDSKSICECTKRCTCDDDPCYCFRPPPGSCTCGDRDNCKCFKSCTCDAPCMCELEPPNPEDCICLDKSSKRDPKNAVCTCERTKGIELSRKLKRVRSGKDGYRWCHDVDPRHTYFDYAYGRHDKIDYKEQENEKFKILGLNEDKVAVEELVDEKVYQVHKVKAPPYEKTVRRPSIDCCSAVGGMSISVETLGEDKDKFLVQVVSHSSKEGAKTGSKLVGILDCNLHTLEENRTEHIRTKDKIKERRCYLAICNSGYYNKITRTCGERKVVKRLYHDFATSRNLILEAANVVLLRYIGLRRYRGNIKTETILMNGKICESIYACLGVSQAIVNNTLLYVVKVERHIIEPSGFIHQTLTVLTLRGYIVSHEWADNCYICHLNPLLRIIPEKDEIETHAPLRERWREDLQLLSDFLDFKSTRSSEGARYVAESGALTGVVRDYLQAILLIRPYETLHFTKHFFGSALSALDLPHDEYFDPATRHVRYYFFEQ